MQNRLKHYFGKLLGNNGVESSPSAPLIRRPFTALEERQRLLSHHVRLVARKLSNGLFCFGAVGGLGKSKTIHETLVDEGVVPVLINSHITPLSLYMTLYQHRKGMVIFLDDCDSIFRNLQILGLLRSALWGQGSRTVTYNSTQLEDVPSSFEFDSRIVMAANIVPQKNHAFQAVLSRIDVFELSATNDEVLDLMREVAKQGFESLTPNQCLEVVDFIENEGGTRQLSMRLLEPSLRKVIYSQDEHLDWRELVRSQLHQIGQPETRAVSQITEIEFLRKAIEEHPNSVKDQQFRWTDLTGKSRASFYRVLAKYRQQKPPQQSKPEEKN